MEATTVREGYELWRPNRVKAESQMTKALVALVLLISAALLLVVTIGGWERLQSFGVALMTLLYAALYIVFAFLVTRWQRGILPVAAALAIILAIFAAVAAPGWFARAKEGLDPPALPEELLGLLTLLLVPVQLVLIAIALIAFNQNWHVEEERPIGGGEPPRDEPEAEGPPPAAPQPT
jgi:4-amino-4-deoxy-L-arabinose transferase-like glycosyltransferase